MQVKRIKARDSDFQKFEVLKTNRNKRHRYGEFFVEGVRNINGAVENGWEISSFIYTRERALSRWAGELISSVPTKINYELTAELLDEISGKEDSSELMAIVKMRKNDFSELRLSENPLLVLFDRPSNRGNLGTLLRSCDGLGADGVILTGHGVDLYDPEVVVASMGSFFKVPAIHAADNASVFSFFEKMREKYPDFKIIGTTAHRESPLYDEDLSVPLLLMIGNETEGLSYAFKESCDRLCTIPMAEDSAASSFNVSCAATVMLYEATAQRAKKSKISE